MSPTSHNSSPATVAASPCFDGASALREGAEDASVDDFGDVELAVLVAWSKEPSLSVELVLGSSLLLEPVVTVSVLVDVSPFAGAVALPLAAVAALVVDAAGGCGRCLRPGGTDARPLHATQ